jgi:hypothetical protein
MSEKVKRFIFQLLNPNVSTRLGVVGGVQQIMEHEYYSNLTTQDWNEISTRSWKHVPVGAIPKCKRSDELSLFDKPSKESAIGTKVSSDKSNIQPGWDNVFETGASLKVDRRMQAFDDDDDEEDEEDDEDDLEK